MTAVAGTDPYGNAYLAGHTTYAQVTLGRWVAVNQQGGNFGFYTAASEAGPWTNTNIFMGLTLLNGANALNLQASLVSLNNSTGAAFSGPVMAADPTTPSQAETWHSLGTLAGCSLTQAAYRMTPEGELELDFHGTTGGANAATVTFSVTLPAAYQPTTTNRRQPIHTGRVVTAGETFPYVQVTTGGAVQVNFNAANINVTFDVNCRIRLDGSP